MSATMSKRRVVVTGLGMLTPVGLNTEDSWKAVLAGKSGVGLIERFDTSDLPVKICGEIKNFDVSPYMDHKEARRNDIFIQFGVAATKQALDDSGLQITDENAPRIG